MSDAPSSSLQRVSSVTLISGSTSSGSDSTPADSKTSFAAAMPTMETLRAVEAKHVRDKEVMLRAMRDMMACIDEAAVTLQSAINEYDQSVEEQAEAGVSTQSAQEVPDPEWEQNWMRQWLNRAGKIADLMEEGQFFSTLEVKVSLMNKVREGQALCRVEEENQRFSLVRPVDAQVLEWFEHGKQQSYGVARVWLDGYVQLVHAVSEDAGNTW